MKLFYSPDYIAAGHQFDTTRKAGWVADSIHARPIAGVEIARPHAATVGELRTIHDFEYVTAVKTGEHRERAESQGFAWDASLFTAVAASTGGVVDAAFEALRTGGVSGSLSSGLHHARRAEGAGFCTFNGLALSAKKALERHDVNKVLILDFDAHHGGGTHDIVKWDQRIVQADVSTSMYDSYHHPLTDLVTDGSEYLDACSLMLDEVANQLFDLVIYNAGMDPYEGCDIGGREGITAAVLAARESLVFDYFHGTPIAFALAGGYIGPDLTQEALVDLHRLTITAAAS